MVKKHDGTSCPVRYRESERNSRSLALASIVGGCVLEPKNQEKWEQIRLPSKKYLRHSAYMAYLYKRKTCALTAVLLELPMAVVKSKWSYEKIMKFIQSNTEDIEK